MIIAPSLPSAHCQPYCCCTAAAGWRQGCTAATTDGRCCTQQSREDVEDLLSTWWTSLASRSAGPAYQQQRKHLKTFKLTISRPNHKIFRRLPSRRRQAIVMQWITANVAEIMTWRFTGEDSAEEFFQPSCWLQHYDNTDTSKMQFTTEEAQGAQSWEKILLLRGILSDGTEDVIEMHDWYRQTWYKLFWIRNLKIPMFFCLNKLEIWLQTFFDAKWS